MRIARNFRATLWLGLLAAMGCGDATGDIAHDAETGSSTPDAGHCVAPQGSVADPRGVADVVTLLNALPKPVALPCFLESLARPLALHATRSVFSAQPAVGRRSPRIFLFFNSLVLSVVPDGTGRRLLELGEFRTETRSLKAEIEFPVVTALSEEAPFERIMFDEKSTSCSFCHPAEEPAEDIDSTRAFTSLGLRPMAQERISMQELVTEYMTCDPSAEADRCALLKSLFGQGNVTDHEFPSNLRTLQ